jgi:galactitol-specific phosphotransferase system IIB component
MKANFSKVVVCGMYRSGSTLLWNMLKKICSSHSIKADVKKVHLDWTNSKSEKKWAYIDEYMQQDDIVVYSRRDIRDVIISYSQREKVSVNDFRNAGRDYLRFLEWVVENDNLIEEESLSNHNILVLNYEKNIAGDHNLHSLYEALGRHLGIDTVPDYDVIEEFRFNNVKKISSNLQKMDGQTQYWPNHLKDGKAKKYIEFLSEDQQAEILSNSLLENWLIKYNYILR